MLYIKNWGQIQMSSIPGMNESLLNQLEIIPHFQNYFENVRSRQKLWFQITPFYLTQSETPCIPQTFESQTSIIWLTLTQSEVHTTQISVT